MKCPRCNGEMERDEVDNGVGMQAVGPWGCPRCHFVEGDPEEDLERRVLGFGDALSASGAPVSVTKVTSLVVCPACGPNVSWRSTPAGWTCTTCGHLAPPPSF